MVLLTLLFQARPNPDPSPPSHPTTAYVRSEASVPARSEVHVPQDPGDIFSIRLTLALQMLDMPARKIMMRRKREDHQGF